MIQLSDIKKKSDANAPTAKSVGRTSQETASETKASETKASDNGQVGYGVLYGRRSSSVHVPLSLPKEDTSYSSTGSALLDSFVSQAIAEPVPLQHLRLVNVANRQPVALTAQKPAAQKPAARKPAAQKPANKNFSRKKQTEISLPAPPAAAPPSDSTTTTKQSPKAALPKASPKVPAAPLFQAAIKIPPLSQPPAVVPSKEKPPAAAEPDHIRPLSAQPISHQPALKPRKPPVAVPANRKPPALRKPATPAIAPSLSATPTIAPPLEDSRTARDSAAAVGLIDINDTLLFGGDHQNLASTDPFVSEDTPQGNDTGVLSYLSQQISAFTVSKLKSGFPNNTDPKVINRPDPPKHKTVLAIQDFKLSQLDGEGPVIQRTRQPTAINNQAPEINVLSQQVNALNQKIAELSQQLAQVSKAQAIQ